MCASIGEPHARRPAKIQEARQVFERKTEISTMVPMAAGAVHLEDI